MKKYTKLLITIMAITLTTVMLISVSGCNSSQAEKTASVNENAVDSTDTPNATEEIENQAIRVPEEPLFDIFKETSGDKIYGFIESSYSWASYPGDTSKTVTEKTIVVTAKILSNDAGVFIAKNGYYDSNPFTPVTIDVTSVILGDFGLGKATIYNSGGYVLIEDLITHYEKHFGKERCEKMELYDLSQDERNSMYMSFNGDESYVLTQEKEYLLIFDYNDDLEEYMIDGFGIFEKDEKFERAELDERDSFKASMPEATKRSRPRSEVEYSLAEYRGVLSREPLELNEDRVADIERALALAE